MEGEASCQDDISLADWAAVVPLQPCIYTLCSQATDIVVAQLKRLFNN